MQLKDKKDEFELMTFNLNYDRWYDLYFPKNAVIGNPYEIGAGGGTLVEEEIEIPVTDIDELDAFFESRDDKRWMSGSDIPEDFSGDMNVGGRRV